MSATRRLGGGKYDALQRAMTDARSREVVFVSHCLLNQNTRYLGGAVCPGVVAATVLPFVDDGVGIVQMPCPEQRVWGGVLKRRMLWMLAHPRFVRRSLPLIGAVERYVRSRYARLARRLAKDVRDYRSNGFCVRGVVGVAGSPSCGVATTMHLRTAAVAIAERPLDQPLTAAWFDTDVVGAATCPGRGLFMDCLADALDGRGQAVPFREVDLAGDVATSEQRDGGTQQ